MPNYIAQPRQHEGTCAVSAGPRAERVQRDRRRQVAAKTSMETQEHRLQQQRNKHQVAEAQVQQRAR
eukprot:8660768-Pyramimonas_sp.AAC.1